MTRSVNIGAPFVKVFILMCLILSINWFTMNRSNTSVSFLWIWFALIVFVVWQTLVQACEWAFAAWDSSIFIYLLLCLTLQIDADADADVVVMMQRLIFSDNQHQKVSTFSLTFKVSYAIFIAQVERTIKYDYFLFLCRLAWFLLGVKCFRLIFQLSEICQFLQLVCLCCH